LICLKRAVFLRASVAGLGLASIVTLAGCSSEEAPAPTEEQQAAIQRQVDEQINANDAAAKASRSRRR